MQFRALKLILHAFRINLGIYQFTLYELCTNVNKLIVRKQEEQKC